MTISDVMNTGRYERTITKTYEIVKVNDINEDSPEFIFLLVKILEKHESIEENKRTILSEEFNIKVRPIIEIYPTGGIKDLSNVISWRSTWGAEANVSLGEICIGQSGTFDLKIKGISRRGLPSYIVSDIINWAKSNSKYLDFNYYIHIKPFGETQEDKEGVLSFYNQFNLCSSSTDKSKRIVSNLVEHRKEGKISVLLSLKESPEDIFSNNLSQQIKSLFEAQYIQGGTIKKLENGFAQMTQKRNIAFGVIQSTRKVSYIFSAASIVIAYIEYWLYKENYLFTLFAIFIALGYLYILWIINRKYT